MWRPLWKIIKIIAVSGLLLGVGGLLLGGGVYLLAFIIRYMFDITPTITDSKWLAIVIGIAAGLTIVFLQFIWSGFKELLIAVFIKRSIFIKKKRFFEFKVWREYFCGLLWYQKIVYSFLVLYCIYVVIGFIILILWGVIVMMKAIIG